MTDLPLSIRDMTVAYNERPVVSDVDLDFSAGRMAAIIGPNGAGKSTLIKAALGLLPMVAGTVKIFGKHNLEGRKLVAYVPQRSAVDWDFPTDVLDVVMMGTYGKLSWFRRPGRAEKSLAMDCLERVKMADMATRQIGQLSGGQQQRVFIARALAQQSNLFLLDEPFAGVDATTERAIVEVLFGLRDEEKTVIAVHHDLDSAREYFQDVVLLNRSLIAAGPVEDVLNKDNLMQTYGARARGLVESF